MNYKAPIVEINFNNFCYEMYMKNKDEWQSYGQGSPYTYEEYIEQNRKFLEDEYNAGH